MPNMMNDTLSLLTPSDVSHRLGIPEATLAQWRHLSKGPDYVKVGRHVRYQLAAVESWIERQTEQTKR